jgi:formylglycine-generating enzyme
MREQLDGVQYVATQTTGEGNGYSTARQTADGTVHLITSRNHYRFNAAWLLTPAPC